MWTVSHVAPDQLPLSRELPMNADDTVVGMGAGVLFAPRRSAPQSGGPAQASMASRCVLGCTDFGLRQGGQVRPPLAIVDRAREQHTRPCDGTNCDATRSAQYLDVVHQFLVAGIGTELVDGSSCTGRHRAGEGRATVVPCEHAVVTPRRAAAFAASSDEFHGSGGSEDDPPLRVTGDVDRELADGDCSAQSPERAVADERQERVPSVFPCGPRLRRRACPGRREAATTTAPRYAASAPPPTPNAAMARKKKPTMSISSGASGSRSSVSGARVSAFTKTSTSSPGAYADASSTVMSGTLNAPRSKYRTVTVSTCSSTAITVAGRPLPSTRSPHVAPSANRHSGPQYTRPKPIATRICRRVCFRCCSSTSGSSMARCCRRVTN